MKNLFKCKLPRRCAEHQGTVRWIHYNIVEYCDLLKKACLVSESLHLLHLGQDIFFF
ncbi:hypothetical protein BDU57DRAFT_240854 [Ampelomyces quisqualis]|uniref:Uncharacterized protein n=1 Tax=Ampelomyces quisqualis TaxID=50730 RepID=A0A6A5QMT1_AMPQU|nr:hypothetical protein BDU57DRAFT_240854 [Ampelomyces quisqualis]